jgi:hypothetical protein
MAYYLTPLVVNELQQLVGPEFIDKFQTEMDLYLQPYRKNVARGRPLSMGKELWEYAVADSIANATWCGAGKGIADVSLGDNIKCDVKSMQIIKKTTTEASMYQPLALQGKSAVDFGNKDKQALWNLFVDGWFKKVSTIKEYYMLIIFRDDALNCSLAGFKVGTEKVNFVESDCIFTKKSMKVTSVIDPKFAQVKAYSGKTRLEIRVSNTIFSDPTYTMSIYNYRSIQ